MGRGQTVIIVLSHRNTPWNTSERPHIPQPGTNHQDKYMHDNGDNKVHSGLRHERADQHQRFEHFCVRTCTPNDYGERGGLYPCIREQYSTVEAINTTYRVGYRSKLQETWTGNAAWKIHNL